MWRRREKVQVRKIRPEKGFQRRSPDALPRYGSVGRGTYHDADRERDLNKGVRASGSFEAKLRAL